MFKNKMFWHFKARKNNSADMDLMEKFFVARRVNIQKILFSVLNGSNTMIEQGFQFSPSTGDFCRPLNKKCPESRGA